MYIIAKDGSGDFTSIQQAIDLAPAGDTAPTILLVRMDTYQERVVVNKDNLRIIGEARDRTVITGSGCAHDPDASGKPGGTFLSATFLVTGTNVTVENLTIRNDAGDGDEVGQAVAVYAAGDRGVWRNCRLIAHQDTLFCGPTMPKVAQAVLPRIIPQGVESVGDCPPVTGRQYFEDCFIQGDVDFIFGPYRCWFERCTLHMNARGGWYTAANTPEAQPHGLVFHACRLTGDCGEGQAYLGRPWRRHARTVFLNCEMDACVSQEGFQDWDDKPVTGRCGEYGTRGTRADQTTRHPGQKRLTAQEAEGITLRAVLGGCDLWQPLSPAPTWFICGDEDALCWGSALADMAHQAHVQVCAGEGRSIKSFVTTKGLGFAELCLRAGDVLLVQVCRMDASQDIAHRTDPFLTYPAYLTMCIDAARRQGTRPVLMLLGGAAESCHASARNTAARLGVTLVEAADPAEAAHQVLQALAGA